ncbi:MAG: M13 family metallopeptidase [Vicinamibacterales bacterium]
MSRLRTFVALVVPLSVAVSAVARPSAQDRAQATTPGFDPRALDTRVDPCNDFYQYACGGWLEKNPIPSDQSNWGRFSELAERNQATLRGIVEKSADARPGRNPIEQKIGDYYASCMDETALDAEGADPLKEELTRLANLASKQEFPDTVARLHRMGTGVLFGFGAEQDFKDATQTLAIADQGGLGLPERDYYFKDDEKSKDLRAKYQAHVQRMFVLVGEPETKAAASAAAVMTVETALAKVSLDAVSRRDPSRLYHKMTREELAAQTPAFDWARYLAGIQAPAFTDLNVTVPDFFIGMNAAIDVIDLDVWKSYLRWQYLHDNVVLLSRTFLTENLEFFGKELTGVKELRPRWKRCVDYVDNDLGELLGQPYVEATFGADGKRRMGQMVDALQQSLDVDIREIPWMTEATRKKAIEKLGTMRRKIGYPDTWRDYAGLNIVRGDFVGNSHRANQFELARQLRRIGQPLDRGEWQMTPPTVNAYYDPLKNDINFPAGILQPPFFDRALDDAVNFGAIGAVIGHEMSHGFDDQGRQFDAQGNLRDWWSEADGKEFERRASCFTDQYGAYSPVEGVKLNGRLTLGENVADNGGVRIAYQALMQTLQGKAREKKDGFTPEQRFFLGYGQIWCGARRPEMSRMLAQVDPHSPPQFRVNGVVSNMPEFAQAFSCRSDAPMVSKTVCKVW